MSASDPDQAAVRTLTPAGLAWLLAGVVAVLTGAAFYLGSHSGTASAQTPGDLLILVAVLVAFASCAFATRLRAPNSRAWLFMTLAAGTWALGQSAWTYYGITRDNVYPFPSVADIGYLGFVVPAAVALFSFPRPAAPRATWLRPLLDALVIASAILFISWTTVLGTVFQAGGSSLLSRMVGIGYPIVDVVMASLVLALGMRRLPGERLPWLFLGGGLVVLAITDSIYVRLTFAGVTGTTGSLLALGWMTAFLLIALAPWVPQGLRTGGVRREYTLVLELLPYVPVLGAILVSTLVVIDTRDPFLFFSGAVLLILVIIRQIMIVFENVTLTRELEAKVAARTAELEGLAAIVNSSTDAIVGKTPDGVITSWNPGATNIYGYPAAEVIGKDVSFLIPEDRREEEDAVMAAAREGGQSKSYESERLRKDGSLVPVALTVSPILGANGVQGIASIGQDITERRVAEGELALAREAALESSRLKSEFLATMSHEIRTPMNGVIGLTGLLLGTSLDDVQRQYAEGVQGAGEALLTVINDILDFSKLEAGRVDLEVAPFDPRVLVEEVAALLAQAAQGKGLELIAYCQPEVPRCLAGDTGRTRQILLNLASNAVKFTASGEVAIRVKLVSGSPGESVLRFEVRDTGIGIAPADHERLFEFFAQADASTTRRYGGTGLGLAISRRLTEVMGGEMGVSSALGQGSTFWFAIPLPEVSMPVAAAPAHDVLPGMRVLVVDDNATNRMVLESQLGAWRMRPEVVEGGHAALVRLRDAAATGEPFDLAVLDMCMPDMDGLELARRITTDLSLHATRLILLTSTSEVDGAELVAAGVGAWLTKPVRSSELYDRLMRLMAPAIEVMAPVATPIPAQIAALPASSPAPSRGRILVVEDNALNQLVAEGVVTKLGYQVDLVANGALALTAIEVTCYAAVLMDCHMPVMDGFEATKAIRGRVDQTARLPIIAMTAGAMDEDRERCLAAGMDDYITKPIDIASLEQALTRWAGTNRPSVTLA